jgi:hypothetical protein
MRPFLHLDKFSQAKDLQKALLRLLEHPASPLQLIVV